MDDETRVLIEQLKRRTANLIYGQSVLEKELKEAEEDIAGIKDMQTILSSLVNDHNVTINVLEGKIPEFVKADQRLNENLLYLENKISSLNVDKRISETKVDFEQKMAILNLTLQSIRIKLEEMIKEQDLNLLNLVSERLNELKIPKEIDVDSLKEEFSNKIMSVKNDSDVLKEKVFQIEGRCLAIEKRIENFALDLKRAILGRT